MNARHRRRGVILILALVVIGLLAGLLVVIAASTGQHLRERQTDRVRLSAMAIADSAVAYAMIHGQQWSMTPPRRTIELDVADITPEPMTSQAHLTFPEVDGQTICRIRISASLGSRTATETVDIPLIRGKDL